MSMDVRQVYPTQPVALESFCCRPIITVKDGLDGVGAQHNKARMSIVFNWDHQVVLFLIDSKRQEWGGI
ncbi:hypothetical protein R1flu_019943 [Riccia fluitans]|uniref:Uncharacterized protein n=1 Tax=Riccia fluitans TaxID=41844 RepID=A0ABD1ZLI5_9MARC